MSAARLVEVVMPQMGESLAEGTVVRWLKAPGDQVGRDESLFEISTDKVDTDVPSPEAGVLKQILVPEGQTVTVGSAVALIEVQGASESNAQTSTPASTAATVNPPPTTATTSAPAPTDEKAGGHFQATHAPQLVSFRRATTESTAAGPQSEAGPYSPAVLQAAQTGNVPLDALTKLPGSGRGGRITKADVDRYVRSAGSGRESGSTAQGAGTEWTQIPSEYVYRPSPDDERVPLSAVRRRMAHHMSWSVRISPHATAFGECDMSGPTALIERQRVAFLEKVGAPLTYTVLVAQAVLKALREVPTFNASLVGDELVIKPHVHLGIAVALPESDDLIVPVIRNANELSVTGLARAIADVAARARAHRLQLDDVQGGTFTLTNPGMFGGLTGTPILNQPQVAILGVGAVAKRAVVVNDAIAIRPVMTTSLTVDHRVLDGMQAFRFLGKVHQLLEEMSPEVNSLDLSR